MKTRMVAALGIFLVGFFLATPGHAEKLYFPHVVAAQPWNDDTWETEIFVANADTATTLTASLAAHAADGAAVGAPLALTLAPRASRWLTVSELFDSPQDIAYVVLTSDSNAACGLSRLSIPGRFRAALPAVRAPVAAGGLVLPHVAADDGWWTGIVLLNTADAARETTLTLTGGATAAVSLAPGEHRSFLLSDMFGSELGAGQSVRLSGTEGLVAAAFYGYAAGGADMLCALPLAGGAERLIIPHLATSGGWWTGLALANALGEAATLSIKPYTAAGEALAEQNLDLGAAASLAATPDSLALPQAAAWLEVGSATSTPLAGAAFYGLDSCTAAAVHQAGPASLKRALLPRPPGADWAGLALLNPGLPTAHVGLAAFDADGRLLAQADVSLPGRSRTAVSLAELFPAAVDASALVALESDQPLSMLALAGSPDALLLDAPPAMAIPNGVAATLTVNLQVDAELPDAGGLLTITDELASRGIPASVYASAEYANANASKLYGLFIDGYEIALHGYHTGEQLHTMTYAEQLDLLTRAKDAVDGCKPCGLGVEIEGFRPQYFSQNEDTYRVLDELGFVYDSGFRAGQTFLPGHETDLWPYPVPGHDFVVAPLTTLTYKGTPTYLCDISAGVGYDWPAEDWAEMLALGEVRSRAAGGPLVVLFHGWYTGDTQAYTYWPPFVALLDRLQGTSEFVTTRELVRRTTGK